MPRPCRDNGGGRLITSEFEPSKAARARDNLKAGGVIDLVEIREGDALETLSVDLPETIDLVLLDGAKSLYPEILSLLESRLKPGALIVADNADMSPDYLKRVRSAGERLHVRALRRGCRTVDADRLTPNSSRSAPSRAEEFFRGLQARVYEIHVRLCYLPTEKLPGAAGEAVSWGVISLRITPEF